MRYRLTVLFALAGVPIVCALLFVQSAVSVERFGIPAPTERTKKITESLAGGLSSDSRFIAGKVAGRGRQSDVASTASRHSWSLGETKFGKSSLLFLAHIDSQFRIWLANALEHTPALAMGLFIVLLVPPLAAAGWLARLMQPDGNATFRVMMPTYESSKPPPLSEGTEHHADFSRNAVLELANSMNGQRLGSFAFGRHTLVARIGREDDNEIQIRDNTVHRYHAAIDRSADSGIMISDLSGKRGNGVVLNGQRVMHAQLKEGDTIGLGAVTLTFRLKAR